MAQPPTHTIAFTNFKLRSKTYLNEYWPSLVILGLTALSPFVYKRALKVQNSIFKQIES